MSSEDNETYPSKGGIQLEGNDFQIKLLELFLKRGLDKGYDFKLATEWDDADKFDDLIFMYENRTKKCVYRFLQAKHKNDNLKKITIDNLTADSGDFSLQKYFISYQTIVRNPCFTGDNVDLKDFIICSNIEFGSEIDLKLNFKELEDDFFNVQSKEKKTKLLQFTSRAPLVKEKIIPTLKKSSDITRLAVEIVKCVKNPKKMLEFRKDSINKNYENVLATYVFDKGKKGIVAFQAGFLDGTHANIQKFRNEFYEAYIDSAQHIEKDTFCKNITGETLRISTDLKKSPLDATSKLKELNNSLVTDEDVHDFVSKLVFAVNLPKEDELGRIIASELHKDYHEINKDVIEASFKAYIEKWIKLKKKYFLTQVHGNNFLCDLARLEIDSYTSEYCAKIEKQKISFKKSFEEVNQFLKSNKQIFNIITEVDSLLGLIKILSLGSTCELKNLSGNPICISLNLALDKQQKLVQAFSSTEANNILIIECKTTYDNVQIFYKKLLKIVQSNIIKKIIFITHQKDVFDMNNIFSEEIRQSYRFDCNFNDLSDYSQEMILEKNILFQGKEVTFGSIVDKDLIDGEVLSKLINNEIIDIGAPLEVMGVTQEYFIDRTFIRHNIFPKHIIEQNPHFSITRNSQDVFTDEQDIVLISDNYNYFLELKESYDKRNIHWFKEKENKLMWQLSHGNCETLRSKGKPKKMANINKLTDINDKIVILAAQAGMGKSTIFSQLANKTKEAPNKSDPLLWIVRINLNNYTDLLKTYEFNNLDLSLDFLLNVIKYKSTLEMEIFKRYLMRNGKTILLFDGFDEISPHYKYKVIQLLNHLKGTKVKTLWVTTRLHLKQDLEHELSTASFELLEFSSEDQKRFLQKYWSQFVDLTPIIKEQADVYVNKLLHMLSFSIGDLKNQFVSIPLQTRMLAETYEDDFKEYLSSNTSQKLDKTLDLIDLFNLFIDKKYKIFFKEKMKLDDSNPAATDMQFSEQKSLENQHMFLALNALFPNMLNNTLFKFKECQNEQLIRVGLVNKIDKNKAEFIHRTFAEYFIALWLSDTDNLTNADVQELILDYILPNNQTDKNEVIFNFFNRILIGDVNEIHTAIINNNINKVKSVLKTNKDTINSKDRANRTPLHLAVIYGYKDIIKVLLEHNANVNCYDKGFNWSPLVYAAQMKKWNIAELLIDKGACSQDLQKVRIDLQDFNSGRSLLHFAISHPLKIDTLKCIIDKSNNLNTSNSDGNTALHLAAQHGHNDIVVALLKKGAIYNTTNKDKKKSLDLAINYKQIYSIFNLIEILFTILKTEKNDPNKITLLTNVLEQGVIIEASNTDGQNILHAAAELGHWDVVQTLITHVRNHHPDILIQYINTKDGQGYTVLHYAAMCGKVDITRYLLDNNADVNTKKIAYNMTPLHYAAWYGHYDVVQTLITHVRNHHPDILIQYVNTKNVDRYTPLHYAAMWGKVDVTICLLNNNADVNTKGRYNRNPLHVAAERGYCDVVQTLISHVRNHNPDTLIQYVNTEDRQGNTALHYAVIKGKVDIVRYLLDNNANVNTKKIVYNMTPLHYAAWYGHCDVVQTLITHVRYNNPDILIQYVNPKDENGNTPLHYAIRRGKADIVRYMLDNNADVNTKNIDNMTPLHEAVKGCYWNIMETLITHVRIHHPHILIQYVNTKDRDGHTALNLTIKPLRCSWKQLNGHVVKLLINAGSQFNKEEVLSNAEIISLRDTDLALYQDIINEINNTTLSDSSKHLNEN